MKDCLFCNKENIVTDFVYEDEQVMAFLDHHPINEGHILLVPKKHYLDVDEIPNDELAHLMIVSKKIVSAIKQIYNPDGYSIMQNGGRFNDIGHYHLHIFPRYKNDGFGWNCGQSDKLTSSKIAQNIKNTISLL